MKDLGDDLIEGVETVVCIGAESPRTDVEEGLTRTRAEPDGTYLHIPEEEELIGGAVDKEGGTFKGSKGTILEGI